MSDVPEGYKMSEVGVIPEDWDVFEFGQLIDYTKGFAFKSKDYRADGIRIIRVSDTTFDSIKEENQIYIDEISSNQYQKWKLEEDDLILSTVGSKPPLYDSMVGKVIIIQKKYRGSLLNQNAVLIRSKKKTKFKQQILLHHFRTKKYLKYIESIFRGNANQASITLEELFQFQIPLPKLEEEQQAIASALSDVDALVTALEQLITKKRNIKQGAMQQLLTGEKRLPGFGGAWEEKRLGEYVTIASGESPSKFKFKNNGTPYYKVDQLNYGNKYQKDTPYFIKCNNPIPKGSIIFPKRGASILLNKVRILTEDAFMDTNLMTLTTTEELDNEYLYYMLIYIGLWHVADTTSIPQINNKHIKPLEIPFPIPSEQQAIAQILSNMDAELEALKQKRDKYNAIKQGMMHELLTGKRRLAWQQ